MTFIKSSIIFRNQNSFFFKSIYDVNIQLVVRYILFIFLALLLWTSPLNAQFNDLSVNQTSTMICAWERAELRAEPNVKTPATTMIYFGELVENLDRKSYVAAERANYVKVKVADGNVGWVNEAFFVEGGELATVLNQSRIYLRPNTISTATMDHFEPGEVVIYSPNSGSWAFLESKNKQKKGWIKNRDDISFEGDDIEIATLYQLIINDSNMADRKKKLRQLSEMARENQSVLESVINQSLVNLSDEPGQIQKTRNLKGGEDDFLADISNDVRNKKESENNSGNSSFSYDFQDPVTGKWYRSEIETGSIYLVEGPSNPTSVYYAYHKDLPLGSKVLLQIPSNPGFVELEVVNRLRQNNPAVIGLSSDCIKAIFGQNTPKKVTIIYLKE